MRILRLNEEIMHRPQCSIFAHSAAAAAKSLQSCLTLCDPIEGSLSGPPVPGILQTRTLEWVAISFSNAWKWKVKVKSPSRVRLLAISWTAAHQAPPSMGFSRQEYWSGLPVPSPVTLSKFLNFLSLRFACYKAAINKHNYLMVNRCQVLWKLFT